MWTCITYVYMYQYELWIILCSFKTSTCWKRRVLSFSENQDFGTYSTFTNPEKNNKKKPSVMITRMHIYVIYIKGKANHTFKGIFRDTLLSFIPFSIVIRKPVIPEGRFMYVRTIYVPWLSLLSDQIPWSYILLETREYQGYRFGT